MPVWIFMITFLVSLTGLTVWNHHAIHGSFNLVYVVLVFFLVLNLLICYWEFILLFYSKKVFAESEQFYRDHINDKGTPMAELMQSKVTFRNVLSGSFWTKPWSAYSLFDGSYGDKRTFGYAIDVGNGLSTLIPSLIVHAGLTYHFASARVLGIVALMMFYQMTYGTVIYWLSFLLNKRHKLLTMQENLLYIVGSNAPWFVLGVIGIWASIRLILDNSYAVIGI